MKVILLENVKRVGSIGEVIEVKRGYARNFLIANKKALYASKENVAQVEKIKSDLSQKDNEKKKDAVQISEQINGKEYSVKKLSTENNELYGSVKPTEIAKLIQEENKIDITPSMIQPIEEIKSLGKFKVKVSLHSEVDAEITISVTSADTIQ
ncbi:50S ribosomal protein L9 [Pelagibacteraceae bacterium]|nr:50S ribosomal protein L9 [Candidatus Pelagibacter sp.]MDC1272367.1 50S ribosomal protein L9 [Pelagibacteraceae bacterium]